jgi:hypothetical protein
MGLGSILLFLAASYTVKDEQFALRAGCDSTEKVVAQVRRGDPVEVRFALAGEEGACYKVAVLSGGQTLEGYLPARALMGIEAFEKGRQTAATFDQPSMIRQDMNAIRSRIAATGGNDPVSHAPPTCSRRTSPAKP